MLDQERFQKNLDLWTHINPKEALLLPFQLSEKVTFCKTDAGELNLQKNDNGEIFHYHSNINAHEEAERWFSELNLKSADILFVYGIGLGYYYDVAKKWLRKDGKHHLVFLEDDLAVLHRLFETEKGTEILEDPQVQLHYFRDLEDSEAIFEVLYWNFTLMQFTVSALKFYKETRSDFYTDLEHKINYDTTMKNALIEEYLKYGAAFFKNFYPNMLSLAGSYWGNSLFGKFRNVPAVICGAGPSLKKHYDLLKTLDNKAFLFAGGSALNSLNSHGIIPHLGAGIDPNPTQHHRLTTNKGFELPFFYRNRLLHEAFKEVHGPKLYISGSGGYDVSDWFEEKFNIKGPYLDEGHNVVNFCVQIARAMGCNPILFIGMDLAFTEMKSYAPGIVDDVSVQKKEILDTGDVDTTAILKKDMFGNDVYTLWKWVAESNWISDFAKEHPGYRFINCTEGGIGFESVPNIPFLEGIEKNLTTQYNLRDWLHGEIQNCEIPQLTDKKMKEAVEELHESLKHCVENFQILLDETKYTQDKIISENKIPENVQTGRAALAETDLEEEIGYEYVIEIFNEVYTRFLNREIQSLKVNKEKLSEVDTLAKRLGINMKKFEFLRDVAQANVELINHAYEITGR